MNPNLSQRQLSHVFGAPTLPEDPAMGEGFSTDSMEGNTENGWAERDVDPQLPTTPGLNTGLSSKIYSNSLASPTLSTPGSTPLTKPVEDIFKV